MANHNLRVYGIIINEKDEVLVSDELRFGNSFTKFPGGGLEWGEGTKDCLKREIQEEIGLESEIGDLFYVNEFFQQSAFRKEDQLTSFYYRVTNINYTQIPLTDHTLPLTEEGEKFRWIALSEISADVMTFPIDKVVADLLRI
ncbi:MAG: NUDIX domain-containing protein [Crocinitomicaceae bacterium]|nr:NUDIX domain-containing protein [Crocinitomicaceae bacterium]